MTPARESDGTVIVYVCSCGYKTTHEPPAAQPVCCRCLKHRPVPIVYMPQWDHFTAIEELESRWASDYAQLVAAGQESE